MSDYRGTICANERPTRALAEPFRCIEEHHIGEHRPCTSPRTWRPFMHETVRDEQSLAGVDTSDHFEVHPTARLDRRAIRTPRVIRPGPVVSALRAVDHSSVRQATWKRVTVIAIFAMTSVRVPGTIQHRKRFSAWTPVNRCINAVVAEASAADGGADLT